MHRDAIYSSLQFYTALIAALLVAQIALSIFVVPIAFRDAALVVRLSVFALLLVLPVGLVYIIRSAQDTFDKEYTKLLEHLTVQQKLEAALGLMEPLRVRDQAPVHHIYQQDSALAYPRWFEDNRQYAESTSTDFVHNVKNRGDVLYSPLAQTLRIFYIIVWALIVILIAMLAITTLHWWLA